MLTPEQKRYFWTVLAILTTILVIAFAALLFGCTNPKTGQQVPTTPQADTIRQRLEQKLTTAKDTANAAHQRTSQTQQPYEDAARHYTALRDSLPH